MDMIKIIVCIYEKLFEIQILENELFFKIICTHLYFSYVYPLFKGHIKLVCPIHFKQLHQLKLLRFEFLIPSPDRHIFSLLLLVLYSF